MALYFNGKPVFSESGTKSLPWAEYQALSQAEKNNGTIYFITDVNGDFQSFQPVIYSEEEREIGVWIDGKPLYQKTIVIAGTSLTAGQSNVISHGISDIDYIQLVNGTYTFGDGEAKLPLPFADNYKPVTESVVVIEAISSSSIRIGVGSNYQGAVSPNTVWVTVQYTKTTDTAGSGQWTPQGVPTHHYSTDEQIVGTWIDGSTVYERVFDLGSDVSISNDTLSDTTIDASNMDKIIYSVGQYSTGVTLYPLMVNINNNIIRLQSDRNGNVGATVRYVILQYTKSST